MNEKLETAAKQAVITITAFDARCEYDGETDTGEAWEILNRIKKSLKAGLRKPKKPEMHRDDVLHALLNDPLADSIKEAFRQKYTRSEIMDAIKRGVRDGAHEAEEVRLKKIKMPEDQHDEMAQEAAAAFLHDLLS